MIKEIIKAKDLTFNLLCYWWYMKYARNIEPTKANDLCMN